MTENFTIDIINNSTGRYASTLIKGLSDAVMTAILKPDDNICIVIIGSLKCMDPIAFCIAQHLLLDGTLPFEYVIKGGPVNKEPTTISSNRLPKNVTQVISII